MTDQKPNRIFFGSSPLNTVAIVIYFGVGYGLIKKFEPPSYAPKAGYDPRSRQRRFPFPRSQT